MGQPGRAASIGPRRILGTHLLSSDGVAGVRLATWALAAWALDEEHVSVIDQPAPCAQRRGFTHVEFLLIAEHPLDDSWDYQSTGDLRRRAGTARPMTCAT